MGQSESAGNNSILNSMLNFRNSSSEPPSVITSPVASAHGVQILLPAVLESQQRQEDNLRTDEDPPVSEYSVDVGVDINKDDGTAPLLYSMRTGDTPKTKKKRRKRYFCCKKKKTVDTDDDNMKILRRFSNAGSSSAMGMSLDESNQDGYDCFGISREEENNDDGPEIVVITRAPTQARRTRIPNRPDVSMSLWSIIKNAIGKDLTKLPLPVNFNEPLSMLQRLAEDYEYSGILDKASTMTDSCEQMSYIAAFTVSSYASTAVRTGKPFNPLLGETYECDRMDDLGWKCLCEQVSHHPPTVAIHCTGRNWVCYQQFTMSSKFRGNSIEVVPSGIAHLIFTETGYHYTWRKVPSYVHNIMIGKLWVDQEGEMDIYNHVTGDSCHIVYTTSSFFRGEAKRVEGTVVNKDKQSKIKVAGYWDSKMESFEILKVESGNKFVLGPAKSLWNRNLSPPDSEKYYNFTVLACQLNEMEDFVAPTDSRRRPDQRLMENGLYDDANSEKLRLEEKQRAVRKIRMAELQRIGYRSPSDGENDDEGEPGYQPAWFSMQKDNVTGKPIQIFNGDYWTCKERADWSRCADIY